MFENHSTTRDKFTRPCRQSSPADSDISRRQSLVGGPASSGVHLTRQKKHVAGFACLSQSRCCGQVNPLLQFAARGKN
jgi:hypothetical protein